jgi:hypothetical protein
MLFRVRVIVFNATFNNISVISWLSVLLVDEIKSNQRKPQTCHKSLTNFITVHLTIGRIGTHNFSGSRP